jgi:hypothetical protein
VDYSDGSYSYRGVTEEKFMGGKDAGLTSDEIRDILWLDRGLTEEEIWAQYEQYLFAYQNLGSNRATEAAWDARYGSVADM